MNGVLESILAGKRKAVEEQKKGETLDSMIGKALASARPVSFKEAFAVPGRVGIIAEMKKKSPSAGEIVKDYRPSILAKTYESSGAKAVSVLTEEKFFGGSAEHLKEAVKSVGIPVLRKDFTLDRYQVAEARALGASAVLLILAALDDRQYTELLSFAEEMGLDALVEVHTEAELERALKREPGLIGINSRDLDTLEVNVGTVFKLLPKVPKGIPVIAESGIRSADTIRELRTAGARGALIGESILKSGRIETALKSFVEAGA